MLFDFLCKNDYMPKTESINDLFKKTREETMKILELKRNYLDNGTFGKITHKGEFICHTVEKPWLSNQPSISCIPPGDYRLKHYSSTKHPSSFSLENENLGVSLYGDTIRTAILIHIANFEHELLGCIAPGLELHPNTWGVAKSKLAMGELKKLITTAEDWILRIT